MKIMLFAGLDLTSSQHKASYIAFLNEELIAKIVKVHTDEEIIKAVADVEIYALGIDAPLSFPKHGMFRGCEKILLGLGIRFFPPTLPSMKGLTKRGVRLASALSSRNIKVLEVYPGGSQDVLCIPRKKKSLSLLKRGLEELGISLPIGRLNGDALDAVSAAYTVYLYWRGNYLRLSSDDCELILPIPRCLPRTPSPRG